MKSRKNKKMLVAVAMVLMIALVAGMGAMTYSKYISSTTLPAQTATAAKWGYVVTTDVDDLFVSDYKNDGSQATATVDGAGNIVVNGTADAKVVAPGTSGSMAITLSGSAEVAAKLTFNITITSDISFDGYNPIKWTLKKGENPVDGCENVTLATLKTKAAALSSTIAPGDDSAAGIYTISWVWDFETDNATNARDTLIGLKATGTTAWTAIKDVKCATGETYAVFTTEEKYNAIVTQVSFNIEVKLEQVQA